MDEVEAERNKEAEAAAPAALKEALAATGLNADEAASVLTALAVVRNNQRTAAEAADGK